jgi:hypothetical protein
MAERVGVFSNDPVSQMTRRVSDYPMKVQRLRLVAGACRDLLYFVEFCCVWPACVTQVRHSRRRRGPARAEASPEFAPTDQPPHHTSGARLVRRLDLVAEQLNAASGGIHLAGGFLSPSN